MILLNDFKAQWIDIGPAVLSVVERVGASGWYVLGSEVNNFEARLAEAWSLPYAVGVANGLDAIEIGLRSLGLKAGDKVLTTPISAFATTLAVMRCGGVPVFVDTDHSGLMDLQLARSALCADRSIRFVVPVHLYGHSIDLDELENLRAEFDLQIVEDCAQAIGARWDGRPVGSVGQVAAVSFYPTKNLGAMGDGGAILTRDPGVETRARALRNYGQTETYVHDEVGMNSRLDEIHAAILGDVCLPRLSVWTARRREIASVYRDRIQGAVSVVPSPSRSESVWHLFPVLAPASKRELLRTRMRERGILTAVHYPKLIPEQKALHDYGRFEVIGNLDCARRLADGEVSLPIHPYLKPAEVSAVCDVIQEWQAQC